MERNIYKIGKELFITSDEEIKAKEYILIIRDGLLMGKLGEVVLINSTIEGRTDYTRLDGTKGWFAAEVNYQKDWNYKKIILTTDQDLIKDGVESIDDTFLEWFVKNPSCEFVETVKVPYFDESGYSYLVGNPQEEPKQELLPEFTISKDIFDKISDLPKQETLEESAKKYTRGVDFGTSNDYNAFIAGANYQAEKIPSIIEDYLETAFISKEQGYMNPKEWFEQFSKLKNG